jgi:hypothetical protein
MRSKAHRAAPSVSPGARSAVFTLASAGCPGSLAPLSLIAAGVLLVCSNNGGQGLKLRGFDIAQFHHLVDHVCRTLKNKMLDRRRSNVPGHYVIPREQQSTSVEVDKILKDGHELKGKPAFPAESA